MRQRRRAGRARRQSGVNPAEVGNILHDRNFVFLFAQRFHPCFRNIAPIRNELGIRTLFNLLGPLINPSRPTHILLGVARPNLVRLMAETLAQSSVHRAAVVCGAGGYDEITPIGPNEMIILNDGKLEPLTLDPADYGIPACTPEDLAVSSRDGAVAVLRELLAGRGPEAMRNMLALNVGMSIYLLEKLPLATCIAKAREAPRFRRGGGGCSMLLEKFKTAKQPEIQALPPARISICCRFRFGSSVRPFWTPCARQTETDPTSSRSSSGRPLHGGHLGWISHRKRQTEYAEAGASCLPC